MNDDLSKFDLTLSQLSDIRDVLYEKILNGLAEQNTEIKAIPAYLRSPSVDISGKAAVLDLGGTNIRAAFIRLDGISAEMSVSPISDTEGIMRLSETPGRISGEDFFAKQADMIAQVCGEDSFHLGYCFSYPAEITPEGKAILLKWTKGINIDNVVGRSVGDQLRAALYHRKKQVLKIAVLNDTVASLLTGAWLAPECTHHIGLVVGTGTNMAGFFPVSHIRKLKPDERAGWEDEDEMAINLESGNFTPPHLSEADDFLDSSDLSDHPGTQKFEKAVSGAYLPRLFCHIIGRNACLENGFDPKGLGLHSGIIADIRNHHGYIGKAADAVINRSADMVAAASAGLIKAYGQNCRHVGILAEGSLFRRTAGYRERFGQTLDRLTSRHIAITLSECPQNLDANLVGAACAVLS
jgi:hexokinase